MQPVHWIAALVVIVIAVYWYKTSYAENWTQAGGLTSEDRNNLMKAVLVTYQTAHEWNANDAVIMNRLLDYLGIPSNVAEAEMRPYFPGRNPQDTMMGRLRDAVSCNKAACNAVIDAYNKKKWSFVSSNFGECKGCPVVATGNRLM